MAVKCHGICAYGCLHEICAFAIFGCSTYMKKFGETFHVPQISLRFLDIMDMTQSQFSVELPHMIEV